MSSAEQDRQACALEALVHEDRALVDRCLRGDKAAWDTLYINYQPVLLRALRSLLNGRAFDDNLVEEIAARVWYGLVRDRGRRLDRFDGRRGYRLSTFLAAFAKRELLQHFRSEQRRRTREISASVAPTTREMPQVRGSDLLMEEFRTTLTPREREFLEASLHQPEDATQQRQFSSTNAWQLKHRVQRKLREFLKEHE